MEWLNYHHLLYFWTVVNEGSVTRASEQLRLAPSTITRSPTSRPSRTADVSTPAQRMTWAQRLRRVFRIDVETCPKCGGAVRIIACIDEQEVVEKILAHIVAWDLQPDTTERPPSRAPPQLKIGDDWL